MPELRGLRVLVVEDEPLVSLALQDMLVELECEVVGTAARLEAALSLADHLSFDIAVLDVDLAGKRVDPVAIVIAARRLPIVYVTGYWGESAPPQAAGPVLQKPYASIVLERVLSEALASVPPACGRPAAGSRN